MERRIQEQFIFGCMFLFANKLQVLGDRNSGDITMKQWLLLIMVKKLRNKEIAAQDPPLEITINKLADFMGYSRQNTKKTLALLGKKGYVLLQTSRMDKRSKVVILTSKAYEYFHAHEKFGEGFLDRIYGGMDDSEVARLYQAFRSIWGNIANMMEETG